MSLAATMQWELMPPLAAMTPNVAVAGVLEPAYDIAGDAFDYAFNGNEVDFAALLELQARASGLELRPENVEVDDGLTPVDPSPNGGAQVRDATPLRPDRS